jgi:HD-GYP domain-containing protein (c-di-GMP phosphodiesterase class II)
MARDLEERAGDHFIRRVEWGEILPGKPLLWDIMAHSGRLLMSRGTIIDDQERINEMMREGVYTLGKRRSRIEADASQRSQPRAGQKEEQPAFFEQIFELCQGVDRLIDRCISRPEAELAGQLRGYAVQIHQVCDLCPDGFMAALHLEYGVSYSAVHALQTALYGEILARIQGWNRSDRISLTCAGLTIDLGLIELQRKTLNHQQGPLTPDQRRQIRDHPLRGAELLRSMGVDDILWLRTVLQHHERLDGSGYPLGIHGSKISESARIMAIADSFSAMIKPHGHRKELLAQQAIRDLFVEAGLTIDQQLAELFVKNVGLFPPGSYVQLKSREIGVVLRRGRKIQAPIVLRLTNSQGNPAPQRILRDVTDPEFAIMGTIPHSRYRVLTSQMPQIWEQYAREVEEAQNRATNQGMRQ